MCNLIINWFEINVCLNLQYIATIIIIDINHIRIILYIKDVYVITGNSLREALTIEKFLLVKFT